MAAHGVGLFDIGSRGEMTGGALQIVGHGPMELEAQPVAYQLRQHRRHAAQLGVAESVFAAGVGEKSAVRIAHAFGNHDHAVADAFDGGLGLGQESRFVERHFRQQDDVRRVVATLLRQAAGGGDPAGVAAHGLEDEHLGGRLAHGGHVQRRLSHRDGDVLGHGAEAGAGVGVRQVVVDGLGDADAPHRIA